MPTTVIEISEEARRRLEARKREGESFTDVVLRLTDRSADVDRFVGKYAEVELEAGVENVEERMDVDVREGRSGVDRL